MRLIIDYAPYAITFLAGMLSALLPVLIMDRANLKKEEKRNSNRSHPGSK
jgi:hypothetical protein